MRNSHVKAVVELLMWEIGKTHADACKEIRPEPQTTFRQPFTSFERLLTGRSSRFETVGGCVAQTRRLPVGRCSVGMGPYNYPLNENLTTLMSGSDHG